MSAFKPKNVKHITMSQKSATTLDGKHTEMANKFANDEAVVIPEYKQEIENLKRRLEFSSDDSSPILTINQRRDIEDRIKKLNSKIRKLEKAKKDYYLQNSEHIFSYFEQKKGLEEGQSKVRSLDAFFTKRSSSKSVAAVGDKCHDSVKRYLRNVDESFLDVNEFIVQKDICPSCRKGELIPVEHDGLVICNNCSTSNKFLVENEKPSYKEPPKEVCFYAYRRINHFREVLAQFRPRRPLIFLKKSLRQSGIRLRKRAHPLNRRMV